MSDIYDVIIIGAGPGGLAAGIYGKRAELKLLVLEQSKVMGGQIINTYEVDNYPGFPGISGFALAEKFREHCERLGVPFAEGTVKEVTTDGTVKIVHLEDGTRYQTRSVIIGTGAQSKVLGVKGEAEFLGMGISYCATCDGAFFKNKTVAVVGGGDVAVEDAIFLARACSKVYVIHRRDEFRAAKTLVSRLKSLENVEILYDSVVAEIKGDELVRAVSVENVKTGEVIDYDVAGVFIAVGNQPNSAAFLPLVAADQNGYILASEDCETNVTGIYAIGDVRHKKLRQVITAAADGAIAITSVEHYLASSFNDI